MLFLYSRESIDVIILNYEPFSSQKHSLPAEVASYIQQQYHAMGGYDPHHKQTKRSQLRVKRKETCSQAIFTKLTINPALLTASGRASRPVPIFPFITCMKVWKLLYVSRNSKQKGVKKCK